MPKSKRTIKSSGKTGRVTPKEARNAVKTVRARRAGKGTTSKSR